jgi:hypothetical protein
MATTETFEAVSTFIEDNIFHSSVWDEADSTSRAKAVNNCIDTLLIILNDYFTVEADIPVNILSNQVVWFMRVDDTFLRAEMGATYIQMAGVMVSIKDKDISIAPYVLNALNITPDALTGGISKRKVGRYIGRYVGTIESIYRNFGRS